MKTNLIDGTNRVEEQWGETRPPEARPTPEIGNARRPRGLIRFLFRLPVWLYRLGLGWLLGERFLLINHVGRKSRKPYQTVVEVARRDADAGLYVVASGYGARADWYRNLRHSPETTIQVGRRRLDARAELLSPRESGEEMVAYARRPPAAARNLTKMMGYEIEESVIGYRHLGQTQIPFVALHTREQVLEEARQRAAGKPLASYFLLAFLLSWLVEVPLALQAQGIVNLSLPFALHYLVGYGPLVAALLLTARNGGWCALRTLFGRMARWRVRARWWLVAFSPLLFYGLLVAAMAWLQGQPPSFGELGKLNFLPDLGLAALPFWVLTFGIGEETGWRGYALPRLQQRRSAFTATLILWFWWALWHLPLFFYTYDLAVLPGFLPGLFAGAIVFTWLYNSTGSILIAAVWHGMFNLTTACVSCGAGIDAAAVSTVVMVGAVSLLVFYKPLMPPSAR